MGMPKKHETGLNPLGLQLVCTPIFLSNVCTEPMIFVLAPIGRPWGDDNVTRGFDVFTSDAFAFYTY